MDRQHLAHTFRPGVLVQHLATSTKPSQQVPIGFDIGEFREHLLERLVDVLVATLDLFMQRLHLARQTVGKLALELLS